MQLLQELRSDDGLTTVRIFQEGSILMAEYYTNGVLKRSTSAPVSSLPMIVTEGREWLQEMKVLNG